jgi:hypothetical protein
MVIVGQIRFACSSCSLHLEGSQWLVRERHSQQAGQANLAMSASGDRALWRHKTSSATPSQTAASSASHRQPQLVSQAINQGGDCRARGC